MRREKLVTALRSITPDMRRRLEDLKAEGLELRKRKDLIWRLLLQSFATMGNSRGWRGLSGNPELLASAAFETVASLPPRARKKHLERVLRVAKIRMPQKKAAWLAANFEVILAKGGPQVVRREALSLRSREAKFRFMKSFDGVGEKYARNVWMDLYDPAFREAIAIDERIKRITEVLGYSFSSYAEHETFYCAVASDAGLEPWEVDRLLYQFRDHFIEAIQK